MKASSFFWHSPDVQAVSPASSLSGSCAQTLLRACNSWESTLWVQQSTGEQLYQTPSNWELTTLRLQVAPIALAYAVHAAHLVSRGVKQQPVPLQACQGQVGFASAWLFAAHAVCALACGQGTDGSLLHVKGDRCCCLAVKSP